MNDILNSTKGERKRGREKERGREREREEEKGKEKGRERERENRVSGTPGSCCCEGVDPSLMILTSSVSS